jgi:hypothetical protein
MDVPLGPREVRRRLETDLAARMLAFCASRPLMRAFCCCSRRMMNGRPYSSNIKLMVYVLQRNLWDATKEFMEMNQPFHFDTSHKTQTHTN